MTLATIVPFSHCLIAMDVFRGDPSAVNAVNVADACYLDRVALPVAFDEIAVTLPPLVRASCYVAIGDLPAAVAALGTATHSELTNVIGLLEPLELTVSDDIATAVDAAAEAARFLCSVDHSPSRSARDCLALYLAWSDATHTNLRSTPPRLPWC